jgi:hypothetical protein
MDYVFYSALVNVVVPVWIGHNITCHWHVNLEHHNVLQECAPTFSVANIKYSVGPAHIAGHKQDCQEIFTPDFLEHNGCTNTNSIEHGWLC